MAFEKKSYEAEKEIDEIDYGMKEEIFVNWILEPLPLGKYAEIDGIGEQAEKTYAW